ncbi:MAG: insulinase family protein, partial [Myxococcales bacterium]|nr:insulinase family protein [Myxococcales bacterium]
MRVLILLLALASLAAAPAPEIPVETYTLDNGLTVILSRDDRLPVVAVELRYLVGSAHEPKGRSGFAHLFEHLMFQGSKSFDDEYFKPFAPIGGMVNGTTNTDRTNYYERVPKGYLELALWMESDRMAGLPDVLTQAKLDNQRDVVKNERRQRYENTPYGLFWKHVQHELHPEGHPYHHTTIGSHEDLTAASLADVKGFFRQYYAPANAVLTIVGDFEPDATKALVARYFGPLPAGERAPTPQAALPSPTAKHLKTTDDVKLARVHLAWPTPALYAAGDAEMDILASVLTDGKSSRLYKPLVYEQKVAKD